MFYLSKVKKKLIFLKTLLVEQMMAKYFKQVLFFLVSLKMPKYKDICNIKGATNVNVI